MKIHAKKCASFHHNYPLGNEMLECDCDGYHTFGELYEHRIELFISLCRNIIILDNHRGIDTQKVWRSKKHSDGSSFEGMFIMGINNEAGKQITYHLPISRWNDTSWAFIRTRAKAPKFDGHTSDDVLNRLLKL